MKELENIIYLDKEQWEGYVLPIAYETDEAFGIQIKHDNEDIKIELTKRRVNPPIISNPEDHDFSDRLYQEHWENAEAYGIIKDRELIACIEVAEETWNNRLRVTELWVSDDYHRRGLATSLMNHVVELAKARGRRALVLETQSSNVRAINFYFNNGFSLIGFDTIHYSNEDIENNEFRIELGRVIK